MKELVLLGTCLAVVAAGCGGDDTTTTTADPGILVTYSRSGGVASMPESLVIRADGSATVEAGVTGAREEFELDPDELARVRTELEAAEFDDVADPPVQTGCADCYVYEITYDGTTMSYDESQAALPASVTAVVTHLSEITADHYPPGASEAPSAS